MSVNWPICSLGFSQYSLHIFVYTVFLFSYIFKEILHIGIFGFIKYILFFVDKANISFLFKYKKLSNNIYLPFSKGNKSLDELFGLSLILN